MPLTGPVALDPHEKNRLRAAAAHAPRIYPGPVGELLARDISEWEEFGYRFDKGGLMARVVDHILKLPQA